MSPKRGRSTLHRTHRRKERESGHCFTEGLPEITTLCKQALDVVSKRGYIRTADAGKRESRHFENVRARGFRVLASELKNDDHHNLMADGRLACHAPPGPHIPAGGKPA